MHAGTHLDELQHGGRKPTETSVTEFCYKSVNLLVVLVVSLPQPLNSAVLPMGSSTSYHSHKMTSSEMFVGCSGHLWVLFVILNIDDRNLYRCTKGSAYTCGRVSLRSVVRMRSNETCVKRLQKLETCVKRLQSSLFLSSWFEYVVSGLQSVSL